MRDLERIPFKTIADREPVTPTLGGWVSVDTGEELGGTFDNPPDVTAEWWDDLPVLPSGPEIVEGYLLQLGEFEADGARAKHILDRAKEHYARRLQRTAAGLARLKHFCLVDVQKQADIDIAAQRGKARSKHYDHGTCGRRKSTKWMVTDEAAARYWAVKNCPEAVKRPEPYLLPSNLPKDVKVPGAVRVESDNFFARGAG